MAANADTAPSRPSPSSSFACIVGAPRCGTTTLARMLEAHPDVCFSRPKEPHFFALHDLRDLETEALLGITDRDYLGRYFLHCGGGETMLVEGSVSYLYAPERMLPILKVWPNARFIIALRDPFQLLPSLHQRHVYQGDETVTDFARAWRLIPERAKGRKIPRSCLDPRLLRYDEAGRLGMHVQRFFEIVGRERCLTTFHEDLAADAEGAYRRVESFLGLPPADLPELQSHRSAKGFKIGWLQRLLKRPPVVTRAVLAGEQYRVRVVSKPARPPSAAARLVMDTRKRLLRWNEAPAPRTRIPAELQEQIRQMLADDVALLSSLTGRSLDHWLGRGVAAPGQTEGTPRPAANSAAR